MMIPKNFIPDKTRKVKIKDLGKKSFRQKSFMMKNLEDLVIDEKVFNYASKEIKNCPLNPSNLKYFGVNPASVKGILNIEYLQYGYCSTILLLEYSSKEKLKKDFPKILEKGIRKYNEIEKFVQTFMFRDNIAIFINPFLREKAVPYYRRLGFKQLDCAFQGK